MATVARALHAACLPDDGIVYGSRYQYSGGGSTNLCLKNAAGDQGGVRQGGQDSNDQIVPLRRSHSGYNGLPSRNNLLRARDNYVIPCAKCKYAKSCFEETGVAECPSGYHKMYTGYTHGGHEGHHGNNNRFCLDKNPQNNDCEGLNLAGPCCAKRCSLLQSLLRLSPKPTRGRGLTHSRIPVRTAALALLYLPDTATNDWYGWVYPTGARSYTGSGLARDTHTILACHQCCVH